MVIQRVLKPSARLGVLFVLSCIIALAVAAFTPINQAYAEELTDGDVTYTYTEHEGSAMISNIKGQNDTELTVPNELTITGDAGTTTLPVKAVEIRDPGLITTFDFSQCTGLTELLCSSETVASITVKNNAALKTLTLSFIKQTSLDLSGCAALTSLSLTEVPLTSLTLPTANELTELTVFKSAIDLFGSFNVYQAYEHYS